jgi:hypothetical protein
MRTIILSIVALSLAILAPTTSSAQECGALDNCDAAASGAAHSEKFEFRLRLKAAFGLKARDLVHDHSILDSGDVGLMIEPLHFSRATLNAFVGLRTVGLGIGHDVTDHFGLALLANTNWSHWHVTPFIAAYFAF